MRRFSGRQLRERRIAAGLRIEHIAVHVNRTAQLVQALEAGRANPSIEVLAGCADLLRCATDDLFESTPASVAA